MYQQELVVPNNIKDEMGALIAPATISDNGVYASPNINWNLPNYTNQVSYTFNKQLAYGSFSGTVTQPLHNAYTATFDVDGVKTNEAVEETKLLQEPIAPTKEGYTFTAGMMRKLAEINGILRQIKCQQRTSHYTRSLRLIVTQPHLILMVN